jgi:hypothetical protein
VYLSPDEYSRIATLSGDIADNANRLLDLAEQAQDEQMAMRLVERAREFMTISARITAGLDRIAKTNAPDGRGLADRDPSLREVIEQAYA